MNTFNLVEDEDTGELTEFVDIFFEKELPDKIFNELFLFFGSYHGSLIYRDEEKGIITGIQVIPEAYVDYMKEYKIDQKKIDEFIQGVEKAKKEYITTLDRN